MPRSFDYDDDEPFRPSLTVYEPEAGLKQPIGFLRFKTPKPTRKPMPHPTRKPKRPARRK